jgi:hypothetical protein
MKPRFSFSLLRHILPLLLLVPTAWAQTSEANLSGTVSDTTGAVIPNAAVKLTSKDQGTVRSVQTNNAGVYQYSFLPPGAYVLEISSQGFKTLTRDNLVLAAAQNARIDFKLEVGNVSENVTVSSVTEAVNTESAELGAVVDNTRVVEMPLNGRVFWNLPLLVPGVSPPVQGSSNSSRGGINIAGSGETANNFTLNGMDNNDTTVSAPLFRPSIDAIQEFNVLTGVYPAQWGYGSGGQIIVTTKAGTNSFHGTAYDFIRNSAVWTARNFFQAPGPLPSFKRNQYGATFGGPIRKNKTFFFFSYEGLSSRQSITVLDTVPTPAMQTGDFSSLLTLAKPIVLKDPNSTRNAPIPGNVIPPSLISPIGAALLRVYPNPTFATAAGFAPANNYVFSATRPETQNISSLKLDHSFSAKDSMYLMGNFSTITATERVSVPSCHAVTLPGYDCPAYNRTQLYSISETHIFNASMVNEGRIGFSLENTPAIPSNAYFNFWGQFGLTPRTSMPGNLPFYGTPNTSITGFTAYNGSVFIRHDPRWQYTDAFSYTRGRHTFKIGFNLSHLATNNVSPTDTAGGVTFAASTSAPTSGYSAADVLFGYPTSTALSLYAYKYYVRVSNISAYLQDDWKVNSRLTLNLGLRWEMNTPPLDYAGHETSFDPAKGVPLVKNTSYIGDHIWAFDWHDYGPRVGFAYQPFGDGKTVVRGGFGTFFNSFSLNNGTSAVFAGYPYTISNTYSSSAAQPVVLSNPFPTANAVTANNLAGADYNFSNARVYEYTLGVQHQLQKDLLLEVTYMGSSSNHIKLTRNINQPAPGPGTPAQVNARRPYPAYGTINMYTFVGNANYQSLQVKLNKRYGYGLSFLMAYTYAHSIDDTSAQTNAYDLRTARGPSSFDVRHRISISPVYELPFGKGRAWATTGWVSQIVGGWQVSPLVQWQTGAPLTATLSGTYSNTGTTTGDRPNLIGDPNANAPHTPQQWFNTSVFQYPATAPGTSAPLSAYSFGNEGVGVILSPGLVTVDVSLVRNFQVREWLKIQARAELFNLMNHTNLGFPGLVANTSTFGTISSALDPRLSQFALKVTF